MPDVIVPAFLVRELRHIDKSMHIAGRTGEKNNNQKQKQNPGSLRAELRDTITTQLATF